MMLANLWLAMLYVFVFFLSPLQPHFMPLVYTKPLCQRKNNQSETEGVTEKV